MMVGRELPHCIHTSHTILVKKFYAENLTAWHPTNTHIKRVDNANFILRKGEILGVAGLVGSGRTEMVLQCIFGSYVGKYQGNIFLNNQKVKINKCAEAIVNHIVMVPEDRVKNTALFY